MESKIMLDGRFRVFSDGSVNRISPDGHEEPAVTSRASRGMKYKVVSYQVNSKQKREYVHRLVAKAFLPNPENYPIVNHKDGNTLNNAVGNLEWCSASYNTKHAHENGLINPYSLGRVCASCGKNITNRNKSGLCAKCKARLNASAVEKLQSNRVFFGVIAYHKTVCNMNNADIACQLGYAKDTVDQFMCGKRVSKTLAYKICELFEIDKDLFFSQSN